MSDNGVRYDIDTAYTSRKIIGDPATPKMLLLLQKWSGGTVKDTRHAAYVLMTIAGIFFAITMTIFLSLFFGGRPMGLQPAEKSFIKQGNSPESYDQTLFRK
ncbi:MAG: hypothetical protein HY617_03215 [Candidatus Sungbacteria bacterium]|nr:hypothetical protein [Candidatus Sungbacteria bacterium]